MRQPESRKRGSLRSGADEHTDFLAERYSCGRTNASTLDYTPPEFRENSRVHDSHHLSCINQDVKNPWDKMHKPS
jgi:hypothetical protein